LVQPHSGKAIFGGLGRIFCRRLLRLGFGLCYLRGLRLVIRKIALPDGFVRGRSPTRRGRRR
jgi:hypothetical protein